MTEKDFFNKIVNGRDDFLQSFIDILRKNKIKFCAIGGLAVNAYAEPVVSLDFDVVVAGEKLEPLVQGLAKRFKVAQFANSINVSEKGSDLRIQIQTDERYKAFIKRAKPKMVLGYKIPVAAIEDVFQGKVWAAVDKTRRSSKRQKDLADIMRLMEAQPGLEALLPEQLKKRIFD
ncbi:MAG: nucleotidyl transferase AbiEii/AbiGii toxin family protein [Nitrospinae bacterium]|nr:nucleotidyl transferase AbiEii/AbiGii toxin family protein [Nitrospinota bacterium]